MRTMLARTLLTSLTALVFAYPAAAKSGNGNGPQNIPPQAVTWNPPDDAHGDHPNNGGNGQGHEEHGNGNGWGHVIDHPGCDSMSPTLPPGLCKRDELPPGLSKKDPLPPGLAKRF
jgi:hypothetical protein